MGSDHSHVPAHSHDHDHDHDSHHHTNARDLPAALDPAIPDEALGPRDVARRDLLRGAGLLGAGLLGAGAAAGVAAGEAWAGNAATDHAAATDRHRRSRPRLGGYHWLAGDHHIHTQYSRDGMYRVIDQVRHASGHGLDWMVITDHGGADHARIGVEKVNPDIRAAREAFGDVLVFQGLEWNIPAAEHGTVFVHPGPGELAVLKEFENSYDGNVKSASASTPENEALAIAGVRFLARAVDRRRVSDALFLANHPSRAGIDTPHEIRGWRDAGPRIAVGMEGAPGHQAAGIPKPLGPGSGRGYYTSSPSPASFPAYPAESYRTWGGFDWMTATVGGLWDSLLAEGRPWWITANSDSHVVYGDGAVRGPGGDFTTNGRHDDPVYGAPTNLGNGDFWPGAYSRTHVGATDYSYAAVMAGIRAGRIWVDHGGLINGLRVVARVAGAPGGVTLGDTLWVRRGTRVELTITIDPAVSPNWAQFVPSLARVDVIAGDVTGPVTDRDTFTAPTARVVKMFELGGAKDPVTLTYSIGPVERPRYFRLRGTDGNRVGSGAMGAAVDPAGPKIDVVGDADPWRDLWFYANPIWVMPL